jgi:toxin CcdB
MRYAMMTEFLASVPIRELGMAVADLSTRADDITAATDFLFQGF